MLETGVRGKAYMPLWITNATDIFPRVALSVNVSLPIWRSRRTDIPFCSCWQIWLQGCEELYRWHIYFCNVTHVSIQDKCSFKQFGTKTMVWLIDLAKCVATTGIKVSIGWAVPYTTYCFVRQGGFECQQLPPHMDCLVNTYKELIVLNRFQKHQVFVVEDENWKGT